MFWKSPSPTSLWIHSLSAESGRFALSLADNPCINPSFHFHLKEGSQYMCSCPLDS
ncbi:hypothetical protein DER46DRAFT_616249 [Fusarium sp. MPI-SDFR-AT-0072]|nr:hypothetical protein DER46DRAFT_616249 [Fusarium sp. MPI-SDFR-AT-0072]